MAEDVIDAEVVALEPTYDFKEPWTKRRRRKKPRGTRIRDHSDFTDKNREKILNSARLGMPLEFCAYFAGVDKAKLERWIEWGEKHTKRLEAGERLAKVEKNFVDFYKEYHAAIAQPVAVLLADAFRAARHDGKIAINLLEKIAPQHYGNKTPQTQVNVGIAVGATGGRSEVHKKLSTEELLKLKELVAEPKALSEGSNDEDNS